MALPRTFYMTADIPLEFLSLDGIDMNQEQHVGAIREMLIDIEPQKLTPPDSHNSA